jgi:hypothetical protein
MNGILAIARLTVMESVRKRIFLALAGFGAAFLVVSSLLPSLDATTRILLIQAWAYRLILLFSVLVTLMLASFSIPEDIEARRFQTLLSKPLRRTDLMLGKFLGYMGVLGVFLAVMGAASLLVIRVASLAAGPAADQALMPDSLVRADAFDPGPSAKPATFQGRPELFWTAEGPVDRVLSWRFDGVSSGRYGDRVTGRIRLRLGINRRAPDAVGQPVSVVGDAQTYELEVAGPGRTPPSRLPLRIWTRRWETFTFSAADAGPEGSVWLRLRRVRDDAWVSGNLFSVELLEPAGPVSFEVNFARALLLIYLQVGIVLSLTLAVSLFASALVTMILSFFLFGLWNLAGFFRDSYYYTESLLRDLQKPAASVHSHGGGALPSWLMEAGNGITGIVLEVIPDFSRLDYSSYMVSNQAVPLTSLFAPEDAVRCAAYLVVPLLLACLLAWRKEFV